MKEQRILDLIDYLPAWIKFWLLSQDDDLLNSIEEIRMRIGQPLCVVLSDKILLNNNIIKAADIESTVERFTDSSFYSVAHSVKNGYITAKGGHRVGICGTAVVKDGQLFTFKDIGYLNIRVAKDVRIDCRGSLGELVDDFENTLIISPPGCGKTTLLRNLVREMSSNGKVISLIDERNEIAASINGAPQFDVGRSTDVLSFCPKSYGMIIALRAMSPEIIAVDEITEQSDISSIHSIVNCGVKILATVHAEGVEDLLTRPVLSEIVSSNLFKYYIILSKKDGKFLMRVTKEMSEKC